MCGEVVKKILRCQNRALLLGIGAGSSPSSIARVRFRAALARFFATFSLTTKRRSRAAFPAPFLTDNAEISFESKLCCDRCDICDKRSSLDCPSSPFVADIAGSGGDATSFEFCELSAFVAFVAFVAVRVRANQRSVGRPPNAGLRELLPRQKRQKRQKRLTRRIQTRLRRRPILRCLRQKGMRGNPMKTFCRICRICRNRVWIQKIFPRYRSKMALGTPRVIAFWW